MIMVGHGGLGWRRDGERERKKILEKMRKNGCIAASHFMPPQAAAASHHLKQLHLFHSLNSQPQVEPSWLNLSTLPSISRSKTQGRRSQALSLSLISNSGPRLFSLHFYFYLLLYIYFLFDPKSPPLV